MIFNKTNWEKEFNKLYEITLKMQSNLDDAIELNKRLVLILEKWK